LHSAPNEQGSGHTVIGRNDAKGAVNRHFSWLEKKNGV
jgi:hypothetical protein